MIAKCRILRRIPIRSGRKGRIRSKIKAARYINDKTKRIEKFSKIACDAVIGTIEDSVRNVVKNFMPMDLNDENTRKEMVEKLMKQFPRIINYVQVDIDVNNSEPAQ